MWYGGLNSFLCVYRIGFCVGVGVYLLLNNMTMFERHEKWPNSEFVLLIIEIVKKIHKLKIPLKVGYVVSDC